MTYLRDSSEDLVYNSETGQYDPVPASVTLTVSPTPNDATVTLTATGFIQEGNSITVDAGTTVSYNVTKDNYVSASGVVLVTEDQTLSIELVLVNRTLTINPTPNDATVTLTATGYTQVGNSITVPHGTSVTYSVSKENYVTVNDQINVIEDKTLSITLNPVEYTLTINPIPSNATVILTADGYVQVDNSITVPFGTNVTYRVSKENYSTRSSVITVNSNETIEIELTQDEVTFTLNSIPVDAHKKIWIGTSQEPIVIDNEYSVPVGTVITYIVYKYGYVTVKDTVLLDSNKTENVELQSGFLVKDLDSNRIFSEKTYIESVDLRNKPWVNNSMKQAFRMCSNLTEVSNINNSVTNMTHAFEYCTNLVNSPNIPDSVQDISYVFAECENLANTVNIPNSVTNMQAAFADCGNLNENIYVYSENVHDAEDCFFGTASHKNVYIPFKYANNVNTITYNSFTRAGYDEIGTWCGVYLKDINPAPNPTLTVTPDPITAEVTLTGDGQTITGTGITSITVTSGSRVTISVIATGYTSKTEYVDVYSNTEMAVSLDSSLATITFTTNAENPNIYLTATGHTQQGNSITVSIGDRVDYEISAVGYNTRSSYLFADEDKTINIPLSLVGDKAFTIKPTPAEAVVTMSADGYETVTGTGQQTIMVASGTVVSYTVSYNGNTISNIRGSDNKGGMIITEDVFIEINASVEHQSLRFDGINGGGTTLTGILEYTSSEGTYVVGPIVMNGVQVLAPTGETVSYIFRTEDFSYTVAGQTNVSSSTYTTISLNLNKTLTLSYTPTNADIVVKDCTGYVIPLISETPGQNVYYMPWYSGSGTGLNNTVSITSSAEGYQTKTITATRVSYQSNTTATLNLDPESN